MSEKIINAEPQVVPPLDRRFRPAALWNREYRALARAADSEPLAIALERPGGTSLYETRILTDPDSAGLTRRYVERLLKFLLWQAGGYRVTLAGHPDLTRDLAAAYIAGGDRAFDADFMGVKVYGRDFQIRDLPPGETLAVCEMSQPLGRHLDGCRIGFDLGGSDRKCAAVIDGEVVWSEETVWNPYFETDPGYHFDGIQDSLARAAAHLPRVDAIGGSAAGVYVENEVRVASLFRGVAPERFARDVRRIFFRVREAWGNIPFEVVNDGEVAALAGSMALDENAVLGLSMGTSQAAGYVRPDGNITDWLNELAFAPIDYAPDAPVDEWSGDRGVGAQYFSQQAVARLIPLAGIEISPEMSFAERLAAVQELMAAGDARAVRIFETIGAYLGYALAHYADFYDFRHVLIMGRVSSGRGGDLILDWARRTLENEFPDLYARIQIHQPAERDKRHGQAAAAASLPKILR